MAAFKKNDWGPYDYHRDFNLTYPLQLMGDVSVTLGMPRWFYDTPQTRAGVSFTYRTLDQFSDKYFAEEIDFPRLLAEFSPRSAMTARGP